MTAAIELALHLVGEAAEWDVLAEVDERARVGDLAAALEDVVGHRPRLYRFGEPLDVEHALRQAGVRAGDTLGVDLPVGLDLRRFGPELHIVAGRDAGRRFRLTDRAVVIGRGETCDVILRDSRVSRSHARIEWSHDTFTVADLGSRNGTFVRAAAVAHGEARSCDPGVPVVVGDTVVTVHRDGAIGPGTRRTGPFHVALTGGRQLDKLPTPVAVRLPDPPEPARHRHSLWTVAAPLAGAGAVAATGAPLLSVGAFAAVPVALGVSALVDHVAVRRRSREAAVRYERLDSGARDAARQSAEAHERSLRNRWPDPATVAAAVARRSSLVWSGQEPPSVVRIGVADQIDAIEVVDASGRAVRVPEAVAHLVPCTVDLAMGPLALIGPEPDLDAVLAWIALQTVTRHSPRTVELAIVSPDPARWAFLALTPHTTAVVSPEDSTSVRHVFAAPPAETARIVICDRPGPRLSAAASLKAQDVSLVWRQIEHEDVPATTRSRLTVGAPGRLVLRVGDDLVDVTPDAIADEVPLRVARSLSGLKVPSSHQTGIPREVRLVDVAPSLVEPDALARAWREPTGGLEPLIGADADGPVRVLLGGHNSHALIAGSTGTGKTRLLESLLLSLAGTHPPDRFSFLVIDFKGGNELARLAEAPHCVGFVSDRDRSEVDRAIRALLEEVARRDKALASVGAADIDEYERITGEPFVRLLVVADEFGQFRREDTGGSGVGALLRVAAQGRSKGVHLVLATQSPSTDVTAEIRQNVGVRICLRVAESAESVAVLGVGDAARLPPRPGVAVVMTDGARREVQSALARSNAPSPRPLVEVRTLVDAIEPRPEAVMAGDDLDRILASLAAASDAMGVRARPLVSPPLPDLVERADIDGSEQPWTQGGFVLGICDRPGARDPLSLRFDPVSHGTMLIVGGPRSGRTTALLTVGAAARAQRGSEHPVVVHAIDWSAGGLRALEGTSLDGGVVVRGDVEHLRRLITSLRTPVERVTRLVLVDRLDALLHDCRDMDSGAFAADLLESLNDGPARRVHAVATVDAAAGAVGLAARLGGPRLVLPLGDPAQELAAGVRRSSVAPPGRAVLVPGGIEAHIGWPETAALDPLGRRVAHPVVAALPTAIPRAALGRVPDEHVLIGVGGATCLEPVVADLDGSGPVILVIGRAKSGRSTALSTMAASYTGGRSRVRLECSDPSDPLDALLDREPTLFVVDDEHEARRVWPGLGDSELPERLEQRGHALLVGFEQGSLTSLAFSHWLMRRPRPGLLLALDPSPDRLVACERLGFSPPAELRAGPPGRGWWCRGGRGTSVQVALP